MVAVPSAAGTGGAADAGAGGVLVFVVRTFPTAPTWFRNVSVCADSPENQSGLPVLAQVLLDYHTKGNRPK